ncbi:hypothetical protein WJX77_004158 [Trebouxia sp. C0004]
MNITCKAPPHLRVPAIRQYAFRCCPTVLGQERFCHRLRRIQTKAQQAHERHMHQGEFVGTPQPMFKPSGRPAVSIVTILILLQAFAIVGAFVGGWLARHRRLELESTNRKLRHINTELRRRQTEDDDADALSSNLEAVQVSRTAMESALAGPSAAHPIEGYGSDNLSLAKARRQISGLLREGKASIRQGNGQHALKLLRQAGQLSEELGDKRAERAVARATANAYREVGDLNMCLRSLDFSLGLSKEVGDTGRDSDVLGEIADVYTEMGDLDKAGQFYDRCIKAMAGDNPSPEGTSSWEV